METPEYRQRLRAIHEAHEVQRRPFQSLHREIIAEICQENLPKTGTVLELGSGFGELADLLPDDLRGRHIQIDWDETSNAENRTRHPASDIRTASATVLPFPDDSCSAVIGLSTFDAMTNLGDIMAEAHRVLIPGGRALAISDLPAQPDTQIQRMLQESIPFPYTNLAWETPFVGLRFVAKAQLESLAGTVQDDELRQLIEIYILNPALVYAVLGFSDRDALRALSNFGATMFPDALLMSMREIYEVALYTALVQNGFTINGNAQVTRSSVILRATMPNFPENRNIATNLGG